MKQPFNEATEVFLSEIHEKKKETALLRLATKGKRLGKKNVLFASDLMSRKEKLKHTKAGTIVTTNLYDNILTIEEFEKLEDYEKRNRLQYLRSKYSAKEIQAAMQTNSKRYYEIIKELDLPKAPRTKGSGLGKRISKVKTTSGGTKTAAIAIQSSLELAPEPVQEIIVSGLHLTFNGTYSAEHIIKQFLKYGALLEGEEDKYYIELKLVQKQDH
jgi:hypothetical protein